MSTLERRLERLEQRTGVKPGTRRIIYFTNLGEDDDEESPYSVKISSDLWANVFGGPLSEDEIRSLKDEFQQR